MAVVFLLTWSVKFCHPYLERPYRSGTKPAWSGCSAPFPRKAGCGSFRALTEAFNFYAKGAPVLDPEELPEVAAGNPMVPGDYPEPERLYDFDTLTERFEAKPDYFLRVKGDSMDLMGFRSGDVVALKKGGDPRNGDVVVARIGEEITLKRYHRQNGYGPVELQAVSSNDEHNAIPIDGQSDFEISGIVVGAIIGTRRD